MHSDLDWSLVPRLLALAVPSLLALGALVAPRRAVAWSSGAAALAVLVAATSEVVTGTMLLLVCGIGWLIVRYSQTYLDGEARLPLYFRWLLLTLSAVTALVVATNLLVIAGAWTAMSLVLHQLLTWYPERTAALVSAHKKFLVSRLADLALWSALALVHWNVGSLELDALGAWVAAQPALTPSMHGAAVLMVLAVALKSAQLPFHGWLLQVMEAPTPVSALLHAGVVNIGGFVLIRLAPWMERAPAAMWLLLIIGLVTTLVAALVMTTRISVKVALAWSTCAQMGFMLVECALGAWHLALLHLVAHSLYKAHAFLAAGSTVEGWRVAALGRPGQRPSGLRIIAASVLAVGGTIGGVAAWETVTGPSVPLAPSAWVLALVVGLALAPLVLRGASGGLRSTGWLVARAGAVALLYAAWHSLSATMFPHGASAGALGSAGWAVLGGAFLVLFALKASLALRPDGPFTRALYPWLFAGLYLDEWFTRFTFRVWPPRLDRATPVGALHVRDAVEA